MASPAASAGAAGASARAGAAGAQPASVEARLANADDCVSWRHADRFLLRRPVGRVSWRLAATAAGAKAGEEDCDGVMWFTASDFTATLTECRCGVVQRAQFQWSEQDGTTHSRAVAVKILSREQLKRQGDSWHAEVRAMAAVTPRGLGRTVASVPQGSSPSVLRFPAWDVAGDAHNVYIATEWLASGSLASWARREVRRLRKAYGDTDDALVSAWYRGHFPRIALQLLDGVRKMHAAGVAHLDLDPHNCCVAADSLVKIIDFGSARFVDADGMVSSRSVKWKWRWASPELWSYCHSRGSAPLAGKRADCWNVGVMLYWMLAQPPASVYRTRTAAFLDDKLRWHRRLVDHLRGHASGAAPHCALCSWRLKIPAAWQRVLLGLLSSGSSRLTAEEAYGEVLRVAASIDTELVQGFEGAEDAIAAAAEPDAAGAGESPVDSADGATPSSNGLPAGAAVADGAARDGARDRSSRSSSAGGASAGRRAIKRRAAALGRADRRRWLDTAQSSAGAPASFTGSAGDAAGAGDATGAAGGAGGGHTADSGCSAAVDASMASGAATVTDENYAAGAGELEGEWPRASASKVRRIELGDPTLSDVDASSTGL